MGMREKMAALVSDSSLLKANNVRLKKETLWAKTCNRCDLSCIEDAKHIVMQCPFYEDVRIEMYNEIARLECDEINDALSEPQGVYAFVMGKQPEEMSLYNMFELYV